MKTDNRIAFPRGIELVVGAFIERADGKLLLCKSPKWSDKWVVPGGHLEADEDALQTAIRETLEETGLSVTPLAIFTSGELVDSKDFHRPAHFKYIDVWCKTENDTVKTDQRELRSHVWIDPEEALTLDLAEPNQKTIREFIAFRKMHE